MGFIDLHLHLDGAITVDIAKRLAKMQGITLPGTNDDELRRELQVPPECTDLNEFLKCFALPCSLLQTKEALTEAVRLVLKDCEKQDVVYAEIRYAPQLHTEQGMSQEDAVLAALEGLKLATANGNDFDLSADGSGAGGPAVASDDKRIKANLILCLMRGEGNDAANEETLRLAKKYLVEDGGVVAIDIAGAEGLFLTKNYRDIFKKANEMGVPFTIHAGEADGAESVRDALDFGASRIGHGVRSNEDKSVVDDIIRRNIPLEMCPTSNRQTHAVEDMSTYPLIDYLNKGVCVTVNTDDPAIEGTTIEKEFDYLEKKFGLTDEQRKKILENSVNAAFTTDEMKDELRAALGL